jgi:hypothetical protein
MDSTRQSTVKPFDIDIKTFNYTPRVMSTEEVFSEMECEIKKVCDITGVSFGEIWFEKIYWVKKILVSYQQSLMTVKSLRSFPKINGILWLASNNTQNLTKFASKRSPHLKTSKRFHELNARKRIYVSVTYSGNHCTFELKQLVAQFPKKVSKHFTWGSSAMIHRKQFRFDDKLSPNWFLL